MGNRYYQRKLQNNDVTWSLLTNTLNAAETYYLDENGWTIQPYRNDLIPQNTAYMFCGFEIKNGNKKQHYYAWRQINKDGILCDTQFGTRLKFDSVKLEQINN